MSKISKVNIRHIIDDFAREIEECQREGKPPKMAVIDFRSELKDGTERPIKYVPLELLRYRKDNGRISSDVLNYEKIHGPLDETSEEAQGIIREFLEEKDKEKTDELKKSIAHAGQRNPVIITCDGFLINGNRRKMVMQYLLDKKPGEEQFKCMKVVILPGKDDKKYGGPPTLLEIEQIENRYQLQSEAKAEYYAFDRALSIRRKIEIGMSLEEQLRDDPVYAALSEKKLKEAVKHIEEEYLKPLECIDRYLEYLGRETLYSTVSRGLGDPEGRWQAFLDYYKFTYSKLINGKKRIQLGIEEDEIGKIEDVAFKIIRKRQLKDLPKAHMIMRDLAKYVANEESKKELFQLIKIENDIPKEEMLDKDGKEKDERDIDNIWGKIHETEIIKQLKKAKYTFENKRDRETPIDLLAAALKKLNHDNMDTSAVVSSDIPRAMQLTRDIKSRANDLESDLYHHQKEIKKTKHNK